MAKDILYLKNCITATVEGILICYLDVMTEISSPSFVSISKASLCFVKKLMYENVKVSDMVQYYNLSFTVLATWLTLGQIERMHFVIQTNVFYLTVADLEQTTVIVDQSFPTLHVSSGDSVLLECPTAGEGKPNVTWTKYGGDLPSKRTEVEFGAFTFLAYLFFVIRSFMPGIICY